MFYRASFLLVALIVTLQVEAAPAFFKNKAAFDSAIAAIPNTETETINFDAMTTGTIIPDGSSLAGVTINESLPGDFELAVNGIGSTSGNNSLGVSEDGGMTILQLGLGDQLTFTFEIEATHAFGLYIIVSSGFDFFENDVSLTFANNTLFNLDNDPAVVSFGTFDAIWLGIIDDAATFTTATLQFGPVSIGEIDDITFTRPSPPSGISEPSIYLLFGIGLLGFLTILRRQKLVHS